MSIERIKGHEKASCKVIRDGENLELISYQTRIIEVRIVNGKREIKVNGLYSRTTIKHIGWFMRDYLGMSYFDAKNIVGMGFVAI